MSLGKGACCVRSAHAQMGWRSILFIRNLELESLTMYSSRSHGTVVALGTYIQDLVS